MPRIGLTGTCACLAAVSLLAAGCGSGKNTAAQPGGTAVTITLTNDGCAPDPATVPAGPVTFTVVNKGGDRVSEAELMRGDTILGEKENLTPGLSGTFSLSLDAGTYSVACPDAANESAAFTVTGSAADAHGLPASVSAQLQNAADSYKDYVVDQVTQLVPAVKAFTDAIRAGDIARAKLLYSPARLHFESVEPVAESFGDLDPQIDARVNEVDDPATWTGFHRIEKALWQDRSLAGVAPIADKLDADVAKLKTLATAADIQPAALANGATELLNEVATTKVTGEEDRYSHTDLADVAANIDGAREAFDLLLPALRTIDPQLSATISQRFADVDAALSGLTGSYAGTTFVDYRKVGTAARRTLTQKVDALAEPLSQVAANVAG